MQRTNSISRRRVSIQRRRSSVSPVVTSAANSPRFQQVSDIRMELYRKKYKYSPYCREVAWCILLMFAIFCCFTAILFGLSFDLHVESSRNRNNPNADLYASDCWTTSLHLRIEDDLSVDYFDAVYAKREELNGSSYGGSDARSWLLSLGQSLLLSLFFWQPLLTYIVTWIKLWMFTWHLEMKVLFICCLHLFILIQINYVHKWLVLLVIQFPDKIPALCKKCCCGSSEDETTLAGSMKPNRYHDGVASRTSAASNHSNACLDTLPRFSSRSSSKHSLVMAHANRPDDVLSFYADVEHEQFMFFNMINIWIVVLNLMTTRINRNSTW